MTGAPALSSCAIQPYFRSYVVLCISGGRHSLFSIVLFFFLHFKTGFKYSSGVPGGGAVGRACYM